MGCVTSGAAHRLRPPQESRAAARAPARAAGEDRRLVAPQADGDGRQALEALEERHALVALDDDDVGLEPPQVAGRGGGPLEHADHAERLLLLEHPLDAVGEERVLVHDAPPPAPAPPRYRGPRGRLRPHAATIPGLADARRAGRRQALRSTIAVKSHVIPAASSRVGVGSRPPSRPAPPPRGPPQGPT